MNNSHLAMQKTTSSNSYQPQPAAPQTRYEALSLSVTPSPGMIAEELHQIETSVHVISTRIQCLQGLIEHERTSVTQVTNIKRELKTAHRGLERFQVENCRGLGDEIEILIGDATRHAWQSYRSMVTLEDRLRDLRSQETSLPPRQRNNNEGKNHRAARDTNEAQERHGVYIPTGARRLLIGPARPHRTLHEPLNIRRQMRERAEPVEDKYAIRDARSQVQSPSTVYHMLEDIHPETFPEPRNSVKRRLQLEEACRKLTLHAPDIVRRGSCNGVTITSMIMCGIEDHRFVLPYFHHIKHHEVRALKDWLAEKKYVERSGGISRMEKVLHCIQLLQKGYRYETLAVIFSRSPRQIKESCHQVMAGLLQLHYDTVNVGEATEQVVQMYMPLWGLWTKYDVTKGRAASYYGFHLGDVAKVLGALNLYIGRWRMQGAFAIDGPAFRWGRVFVVEMASAKRQVNCNNALGISDHDYDENDETARSY